MSDPVARLNTALEGCYAIERELGERSMVQVQARRILTLLLLSLTGCGGAKTPTETSDPPVATTVVLSPSSLVLSGPGDTATVAASVMDAGGSEITSPTLAWTSADESIATVSVTGLVTAVGVGTSAIIVEATSGGQSVIQQASITVNGPPVVLLPVVLLPTELCSDHSDADFPTFADAQLEMWIRRALSIDAQDSLTCGMISAMTHLGLGRPYPLSGVQSLTGMQNLTGLTRFGAQNHPITDISPLSGLIGLDTLRLWSAQVSDVSPLSGHKNLLTLTLSDNAVTDISPLNGLTSLRTLDLADNAITDISPLSALPNLFMAYLSNNLITDSALRGNPKLAVLDLSSNRITELSGVGELPLLSDLNLSSNSITDISALSAITLTYLDLSSNSITDISALSAITVTYLDLSSNSITDISAFSGLSRTHLDLSYNSITDVSPLSGLSLVGLDLSHNSITDLVLSELTELEYLFLNDNSITDISALSALGTLRLGSLWLQSNSITDISALSGLTRLNSVQLHDNWNLSQIQPLIDNPGIGLFCTPEPARRPRNCKDLVTLQRTNVSCADVALLEAKGARVLHSCMQITSTSLSNGFQNTGYSQTLTATGGDGSYSWALASGSGPLPTGLTLATTGDITGTPTVVGTSNFTVEVTSGTQHVTEELSVTIDP